MLDYRILFDGEELNTVEQMNQKYARFNSWELYYPKGARVNRADKNTIQQRIKQAKDNDIEEQWSIQFENNWEKLSHTLFQVLKEIKDKKPISLTKEDASEIMKYFVMFDWRGFSGNTQFNEILEFIDKQLLPLSDIEIPKEERMHPLHRTAFDEIRHNSIVRIFGEFLSGTGVMQKQLQMYEENLSFVFLLTPDKMTFITSDNPSFTFENKDGYKEPLLIILPHLAISLARKDPDEPYGYKIALLDNVQVAEYNSEIFAYAQTLVLNNQQIDPGDYTK